MPFIDHHWLVEVTLMGNCAKARDHDIKPSKPFKANFCTDFDKMFLSLLNAN
jgi:hypothetical protein